jgi:F-type H+-transporting ATPase subunit epsilon
MAKTLLAEIVTPEGILYANEVEMVVAPTPLGEIGILPLHAPLVSKLAAGEVRLKYGSAVGDWEYFAVYDGYVQVHLDKVTVLADRAVSVSEIDVERAKEAVELIRQKLAELPEEAADEREAAQSDLRWYEIQISRAGRKQAS